MNAVESQDSSVVDGGFVNVPYAASFLGVSRSKLYGMMDDGELTYAKFGRSRRVPRRALLELAQKCLVRGDQVAPAPHGRRGSLSLQQGEPGQGQDQ